MNLDSNLSSNELNVVIWGGSPFHLFQVFALMGSIQKFKKLIVRF